MAMDAPEALSLADRIARRLMQELDEGLPATSFLESGSTSLAFRVTTPLSAYMLRIAAPRAGKQPSYESDYAIRTALADAGLPVAAPIATDQTIDIGLKARWALDEFVAGAHPSRGEIAPTVSRQLGGLLRTLHRLPVTGFGELENSRQRLRGTDDEPVAGMLARFKEPWPFQAGGLDNHPTVRAAPALLEKLLPLESELTAFVESGPAAIVHSDLHEGQLLADDGALTALLDFNDAVAGRAEWDLGSYLYFHGERALNDLIDGYADAAGDRDELALKAKLAAILIALHHGNRGRVLARPQRITASARFLADCQV